MELKGTVSRDFQPSFLSIKKPMLIQCPQGLLLHGLLYVNFVIDYADRMNSYSRVLGHRAPVVNDYADLDGQLFYFKKKPAKFAEFLELE